MILTPAQIAARWQCSALHVQEMVARGELPAFRVRRMVNPRANRYEQRYRPRTH